MTGQRGHSLQHGPPRLVQRLRPAPGVDQGIAAAEQVTWVQRGGGRGVGGTALALHIYIYMIERGAL